MRKFGKTWFDDEVPQFVEMVANVWSLRRQIDQAFPSCVENHGGPDTRQGKARVYSCCMVHTDHCQVSVSVGNLSFFVSYMYNVVCRTFTFQIQFALVLPV